MPSLQQRKYFPQGIASFAGALQLTKAIEVANSDELVELDLEPDRRDKVIETARNIVAHGKIVQVDGGGYGANPPTNVWHPKDTKYGSIDKTNMFGSHADQRQLVEETWLWDDRHGLPKPERYAKAIAENMTRLLMEIAREGNGIGNNERIVKLRDERIKAMYKRATVPQDDEGIDSHPYHFMQSKYQGCRTPFRGSVIFSW